VNGHQATGLKWLEDVADNRESDAAALGHDGSVLSYGDLLEKVSKIAARLSAAGITPHDRVIIIPANDVDGTVLTLAAASIAGCAVINPLSTSTEVERIAGALLPAAILASEDKDFATKTRRLGIRLGIPVITPDQAQTGGGLSPRQPTAGRPEPQWPGWTGIILSTSGTTASGKFVPLSWPTMLAAAEATAAAYRLSPSDRRLNIMPIFHVQGLVGSVLSALVSGGSILLIPTFEPAQVTHLLQEADITWFSATPPMHTQIMDAWPGGSLHHHLRFVRVGSSALSTRLRQRLASFYRVPIVESYGMTEAHQIASTPLDGDGAGGLVPTGSQVAIRAQAGILTAPGVRGEIVVRGDNVADRYLAATDTEQLAFRDGWFHTGDEGELRPDGTLGITGRLKEFINRGGEKISPAEVEEVLLSHRDVSEAAVVGLPDDALGQQVAAAVVLRSEAQADEAGLLAFTREHLAPHKQPRQIAFLATLPRTPSGKVSRATVAAELARSSLQQADFRPAESCPPSGPVEPAVPQLSATHAALTGIWSNVLGRPVGPDDDFIMLGGASISAMQVLQDVAAALSVRISLLTMFDDAYTVRRMAEFIDRQRTAGHVAAMSAPFPGPLPAVPASEDQS